MRHVAVLIVAAAAAAVSPGIRAADEPGFWSTPAIAGYGKMHALPQGAYQPDPRQTYRVVFAMTAAPKAPGDVNPALERVARAVNLYVSAGVPLDHLKFVAIAYGPATPVALDDAHYKSAYGVANPNLTLIARLRKAGVDVAVCGQAWAEHKYQHDWLDPSVTLALSAIVTITELEQQGYHLMPLP